MKTDQTARIVQSCMTEMLWRLNRLRGSCNLVGLKCYEDWSDCADRAILYDWNAMKTNQTARIVQSCRTEMLIRLRGSCNLVCLKCYEDWSDCADRAILYDWNAMKTDQTARIVQSCMTEMLWRLIRLRGSCNLVCLKCYEDWSDCADRAILYVWNAMKTNQTARIVQSCRTEMLCLGLFIFFFANVTLKIKEVGCGYYDRNMKHCKIRHVRPLKTQISLCSLILGLLCSSSYFI